MRIDFFSFKGTWSQLKYFIVSGVFTGLMIFLFVQEVMAIRTLNKDFNWGVTFGLVTLLVTYLVWCYGLINFSVKRLRHAGKALGLCVLPVIPLIGFIGYLVVLFMGEEKPESKFRRLVVKAKDEGKGWKASIYDKYNLGTLDKKAGDMDKAAKDLYRAKVIYQARMRRMTDHEV